MGAEEETGARPEPAREPPAEGGPEEGGGRRPRRSRWWWLVRGPVYLLVLLLLILGGLYLFVESDMARERARELVIARLSEALRRDVQVGTIDWSWSPLSVEATDVVIPSPWPDAPPFATVEVLRIDARIEGLRLFDWQTPVVALEEVFLEEPRVYLAVREDGTNNLPEFAGGGPGQQRIEVRLEGLLVEQGTFLLNEMEIPLDLAARGLYARLDGTGGQEGRELEGLVTAQDLVVEPPGGAPYRVTLSAKGRFGPERLELSTVRVAGPDLRAEARGVLELPEAERRLELEVEVSTQAALAGRLGYLDAEEPPVTGPLRFEGSFLWSPEGWSVVGPLASERLVAGERVVTDLVGTLKVDPERVRYDIDRLEHAGGAADGVVVVDYGGETTEIAVDLGLRELGLGRLAADQGLELPGLAGRISGDVSYRFVSDRPLAGSGWADLALSAAQVGPVPGGLALTGQVPLTIDQGVLEIGTTRLGSASGRQVLQVGGRYDLDGGAGRFDVTLVTRDLGEVAALVPEGEAAEDAENTGEPAAWLPTAGTGRVSGTVRVADGTVRAELVADLADVVAPGLLADRLDGTATVTGAGIESLMLEATHDGGALLVTGSVPFGTGEPGAPAPPPLELTVDLARWPGDERLAAWLPLELPVAGPLTGRVTLGGTTEALAGRADLSISPATLSGVQVESLQVAVRFGPDRVVVERARLDTGAGTIQGAGTVALESGELDFRLVSNALDLGAEPVASQIGADLRGVVEVAAQVSGTLERPRVVAEVAGTGLELAGQRIGADGAAHLRLAWNGEEVEIRGGVPGLVEIAGGGALTTEGAAVEIRIASDELGDLLASLLPEAPDVTGGFSGVAILSGLFARPDELDVSLRLDELALAYEDRLLENLEPVEVRLAGDRVVIDSLFLAETTTSSELFVVGSIGLGETQPLDLRVQGSLATDWLELVAPDLELEGTFDVLATVGGTLTEPEVNGQGELRDGRFIPPGFPQSLEDLSAVVLFYPDQLVLDRLEAEIGRGHLIASGDVDLYDPRGPQYQFQAFVEEVSVRYPEGFWIRGDASVNLVSTPDGRVIRGSVELDRAFYLKDVELSLLQLLRRSLQTERLEVAETDEFSATTQLALAVTAPPGAVRVRNNVANLRGTAELAVRGTIARPAVLGTLDIQPGGTLVYAEDTFEVERARLTFADPARIDPLIDLEATTEVNQYDVTLSLSGKVASLTVELRSDPPLSDLDIVALLTTGSTLGEREALRADGGGGFNASAFLAGQAASVVADRVNTLFGFDQFRISPVGSDTGGSISGVGVTVGKQISRDVFVSYTENPASTELSFLQVEWRVDENITLVFTRQGDDSYRVAAQWEQTF